MKKKLFFVLFTIGFIANVYGQSNVTNNNTITINGNVYYFRPANTPSSPPPTVGRSDFISEGSWYGEDAARAWASISDWAIETCSTAESPVIGRNGERVYIHQVHAYQKGTTGGTRYINDNWGSIWFTGYNNYRFAIIIYYWVVAANTTMENGRRETRIFWFN
jgi:hypothetical protein